MNLYRFFERILLKCIRMIWMCFIMIHEYKNLLKRYHLFKDVKLTDEQKKQIDDFYLENYGKKIPYWWHRMYMSYTGRFDYRYIPDYIYTVIIEPRTNHRVEVMPLEDKNMLSVIFGGDSEVKIPETYLMRVRGKYFDSNRSLIKEEDAVDRLNLIKSEGDAVIKITVDSSSGRGVRMLKLSDGMDEIENEPIKQVMEKMGDDFVIQERLCPHPAFAALYSGSINTLRVVTYLCEGKIDAGLIFMRIGQGGGTVDNAHAGGMFIGVTDEGRLLKEAFTENQNRYTVHPDSGVVFENYQIPLVAEIRKAAIRLHQRVPMLHYISWDFTVDSENRINLIEVNLHSQAVWASQMAHGEAIFRDDTAEILQICRDKVKRW